MVPRAGEHPVYKGDSFDLCGRSYSEKLKHVTIKSDRLVGVLYLSRPRLEKKKKEDTWQRT